ncbi:hypothetical protein EVAR_68228_1 [Eumeta japonica]|uniref:Uncharacterized protein n=1 Tax=Eumeta variegata TaxID=151549 RepID=A0A4C1ZL06_EUMVA|nr:hypothetical protein EVAR_68228_1 [Eumeta japonica]
MLSLRNDCRVSLKDRCRNSDDREQCGLKEDVVTRVERGNRKDRKEQCVGQAAARVLLVGVAMCSESDKYPLFLHR